MAGHSKFKNIMYRKGAQDKKRAKEFSKFSKEIIVAAKLGGADPMMNPRLRTAIAVAKGKSMPKENIERAIKKGTRDTNGVNYSEIRYEGYGPSGVAIIIEALTDNKNRTASEIRAVFSKYGGNLGETGSVAFSFERRGLITFGLDKADFDTIFEVASESGATDVEITDAAYEISCEPESLALILDALSEQFGNPLEFGFDWKPTNTTNLDENGAHNLMKLLDALEDNDDVQNVFTNMEIADEIMDKLSN